MNEPTQEPADSEKWETDFHRWGKRPNPELRPFFYTRLQARLAQSGESVSWLPWWLRQPAYAYSALLLLVLLNIGVVTGAAWWGARDEVTSQATTTATAPLYDYEVDPVILAYE
jgi:hypothetical protein